MPEIIFYTDEQFSYRLGHITDRSSQEAIYPQYKANDLLETATKHAGKLDQTAIDAAITAEVTKFKSESLHLGNPNAKANTLCLEKLLKSPMAGIKRDFAPIEVLKLKRNPAAMPFTTHNVSSLIPTSTKDSNLIARRTAIVFCWDMVINAQPEPLYYFYSTNGERITVTSAFHNDFKDAFENFIHDFALQQKNQLVRMISPTDNNVSQIKAVMTELLNYFRASPYAESLRNKHNTPELNDIIPHSYYILREQFENIEGSPVVTSKKLCLVSNTNDIKPQQHLVLELANAIQAHKNQQQNSIYIIKYYLHLLLGFGRAQLERILAIESDRITLMNYLKYCAEIPELVMTANIIKKRAVPKAYQTTVDNLQQQLHAFTCLHKLHAIEIGVCVNHDQLLVKEMHEIANSIDEISKDSRTIYFYENPDKQLQLKQDYNYYKLLRRQFLSKEHQKEHEFSKTFTSELSNEHILEEKLKRLIDNLNKFDTTAPDIVNTTEEEFHEIINNEQFNSYIRANPDFRRILILQYNRFQQHLSQNQLANLKPKPTFKLLDVICAKEKAIQLLSSARRKCFFQTNNNINNLTATEKDINNATTIDDIKVFLHVIRGKYEPRGGFFTLINKLKGRENFQSADTKTGQQISALINSI